MALQANWNGTGLYIWGDANNHAERLSLDALRGVIAEFTGDALLVSAGLESTLSLRLSAPGAEPALVELPTLRFSPADAMDLLVACPMSGNAECSDSVRYWSILARFALRHIVDHQFFPDLDLDAERRLVAIWRLMVDPNEGVEKLERFAAAMPPVCLAHVSIEPTDDREEITGRLVESFLLAATNAVIRRDVTHDPWFLRVHTEPEPPPEVRWLSALLGNENGVKADVHTQTLLGEQVRTWIAQLEQGRADAPWPLAFVLVEPEDEDDDNAEAADLATTEGVWLLKL